MGNLTHTVSGDIASFRSAARVPIESLKCHFLPVQSGSGDASPDNIRSISGWNNIQIYQSKKNLYANGDQTITTSRPYVYKQLVNPLPPGNYIFSAIITSIDVDSNTSLVRFFGDDGSDPRTAGSDIVQFQMARSINNSRVSITFNLDRTASWIYLYAAEDYRKGVNDTADFKDIMIEAINTTNEYEEYQGQTYTINWTNDAGTLYGGYIDLIAGTLVATHACYSFTGNEADWATYNSGEASMRYSLKLTQLPITFLGTDFQRASLCICSHFQLVSYIPQLIYGKAGLGSYFQPSDPNGKNWGSLENYKAWLIEQAQAGTPVQLCGPIEPITYQLSPYQLKTFLNYNNIWSNTNDITEVSYYVNDSNMIRAAKLAMMHTHDLPPAYEKYDWLQTYGNDARIDTGVAGDDTTLRIQSTFMPIELNNSYAAVFGNYQTENDHYCWRCILAANTHANYTQRFYVTVGNGAPSGGTAMPWVCNNDETMVNKKIKLDMSYGEYTLVGTVTSTGTVTTKDKQVNTRHITIGASFSSATGGTTKFRIYAFKLWSHNVLIRNYIPVKRKSDNKTGFYDLVNHTFNPSIGAQQFIAGNDT